MLEHPTRFMANKSFFLDDSFYTYLLENSLREPELLAELREETSTLDQAEMQIAPEQGQFMRLIARLMGARKTLEVGVFTGYSSLSVALGLPEDGRIVAMDVNEEWTAIAERYWERAGVREKIDLRIGRAEETLAELIEAGHGETFDMAFIDADKTAYDVYYERALELVRPGGLVMLDNVFRSGRVADPEVDTDAVRSIRQLNARIHRDERVELSMVPMADGLTLARKVEQTARAPYADRSRPNS